MEGSTPRRLRKPPSANSLHVLQPNAPKRKRLSGISSHCLLSTPFHKYRYERHHTARAWTARSGRHRRVPGFSRHLPLATVFRRWSPSRRACRPQPASAGLLDQRIIDACADRATVWETWHGHLAHGASRATPAAWCHVPTHARVAFRPLRQARIRSIVRAMSNNRRTRGRIYGAEHYGRPQSVTSPRSFCIP